MIPVCISLNKALDKLRDKVPLQPYLSGHISILDQGHGQKLSKIETLRLAQNYIQLLTVAATSQRKMQYDDIHHLLSRNLSQATANLLRARLIYDLDYSIAKNLLEDEGDEVNVFETEQCQQCSNNQQTYPWSSDDGVGYSEYVELNPFYGCCYK